MANLLTQTHITQLRKVATKLAYKQKMDSTQLILGLKNRNKIERAEKLLYKAINLLQTVK